MNMRIPLQGEQAENAPFPPGVKVSLYRTSQRTQEGQQQDQQRRQVAYEEYYASGIVVGALLEVNGPNSCQIIHRVKILPTSNITNSHDSENRASSNNVVGTISPEYGKEDESIIHCNSSQLRFCTGCRVLVKEEDAQLKEENDSKQSASDASNALRHGIVIGTVDVPTNEMRQELNHSFWYSIYFPPSNNSNEGGAGRSTETQQLQQGWIQHEIIPERVVYEKIKEPMFSTDSSTPSTEVETAKEQGKMEELEKEAVESKTPTTFQQQEQQQQSMMHKNSNEAIQTKDVHHGDAVSDIVMSVSSVTGANESTLRAITTTSTTTTSSSNSDKNTNDNDNILNKNKNDQYGATNHNKSNKHFSQNTHESSQNWGYELFIGNIPSFTMNEYDLTSLFQSYGKILRVRMLRGCAKIKFKEEESCFKVVEDFHNQVVFNPSRFPVRVTYMDGNDKEFKIYVHHCETFDDRKQQNLTKSKIHSVFARYGTIRKIYLVRNLQNIPLRSAMIVYQDVQSVVDAMASFTKGGKIEQFKVMIPDFKSHERHLHHFGNSSKIVEQASVIPAGVEEEGGVGLSSNTTTSNNVGRNTALQNLSASYISASSASSMSVGQQQQVCNDDIESSQYGPQKNNSISSVKRKACDDDHCLKDAKYAKKEDNADEVSSIIQSTHTNEMYIARVYFPLSRKVVTGCLIGEKGINHKALLKCTNCKITAIQDDDLDHAVEVTGDSRQRVEDGANRVLHHLLVGMGHSLNEDLRRKCYIDFGDDTNAPSTSLNKENHSCSSNSNQHSPPPVRQITTIKNQDKSPSLSSDGNSKRFNRHHDDAHYRIILPLPKNSFRDYIIGHRGIRHKELLKYLRCKMITLQSGSDPARTSFIEVYDYKPDAAYDAAQRLLELIKVDFGECVSNAGVIRLH